MKCDAEWARKHEGTMAGDGHDWVLVPPAHVNPKGSAEGLLWACPCSEFKWTSYAEWEARISAKITISGSETKQGAALTREDIQATVDRWKEPEGKPDQP